MRYIIVFLLLYSCFCRAYEYVPSNTHEFNTNIQYLNNNDIDINFDKMKKSDKITKAQNELNDNLKPKIQFDTRQIKLQRALDYTTRQNNTIFLPRF